MECLDDLAEDKNLILDDLAKISVFFFFPNFEMDLVIGGSGLMVVVLVVLMVLWV